VTVASLIESDPFAYGNHVVTTVPVGRLHFFYFDWNRQLDGAEPAIITDCIPAFMFLAHFADPAGWKPETFICSFGCDTNSFIHGSDFPDVFVMRV
jgi:hypothetical protein